MIDLTDIINALLVLLASIITGYLVPWLKAKCNEKQRFALESTCRILVFAAEQIYGAGRGEEKLDYVVQQLKAKGLTVDIDMIEATVKQYFGKWDSKDDTTAEGTPQSPDGDSSPTKGSLDEDEDEEPQTPLM